MVDKVLNRSVVNPPTQEVGAWNDFVIWLASIADDIVPWGGASTNFRKRDIQLRQFWMQEPILASALYTICIRDASFSWTITGDAPRTVEKTQMMLHNANLGKGWLDFAQKWRLDFLCLAGATNVSLAGDRLGKVKTIAQIVKDKDHGPVLSIAEDGSICVRNIVEWHKTPLGDRKWWWISAKNSQHSGNKKGGLFLTEDHPMLTENGWIQAKDIKTGMKIATSDPTPNEMQSALLTGMMLGDASIGLIRNRAMVRMTHAKDQEIWLQRKMSALKGFQWTGYNITHSRKVGSYHSQEIIGVNTRGSLGLMDWRRSWYPDGKKIVNRKKIERHFSPLMLAAWYCDDGSMHRNYSRNGNECRPNLTLNTQGFTLDDNLWLAALLTQKGFETKVQNYKSYNKSFWCIRMNVDASHKFWEYISSFVPPEMRYKLPQCYDNFKKELWELGNAQYTWDEVTESRERSYKSGVGEVKTTYHIGVEETRNFIAAGLVSHNTQDNGAFFEVIRQTDSENSPVIGINTLDAGRCRRTGVPEWPVIYTDRLGIEHKLKPWQIVMRSDFPSPIETTNGIGFCAVSRVLRMAQTLRDIGVRDRERMSGMDPKTIHIITGVTTSQLEQVLTEHKDLQLQQGHTRYSKPALFGSVDPNKPAQTASLDLAPAPDIDYDLMMRWYITLLAMAIGVDYQDLAPLPSKGIGGSQQSLILHEKSKGKGPELFMKTIEHIFNFHGVIPANVSFEYQEKDIAEETERASIQKVWSESTKNYVEGGVLSPQGARNMLLDEGLLSQEIFDAESMGADDVTDDVQADDDTQIDEPAPEDQQMLDEGEKQKLSPFASAERKRWEKEMQADIYKALKKLYRDLKTKILPSKMFGTKANPEDIVNSPKFQKEFRTELTKAMLPNARQVFLGAAAYNNELGLFVNMDAMNIAVEEFSRTYMTDWLGALEQTTQDGLRQKILTWQQGELGKEGLPDLVKSIEPLFGEGRAKRIAQTETTRVFDLGNKAAHIAAGIKYEQWQTANDERVRPEHADYQGKVFDVNSGPRPSNYINCRCARVPISEDEALKIGVTNG